MEKTNRLPYDVAYEVACMIKYLSKDIYTEKKNINTHVIAESIVKINLLKDTIAWKQYMVGV